MIAPVVVGAAVLAGVAVVGNCTVEVLSGAELVLWAIGLLETGGCCVGVGAAEVKGGKSEVLGNTLVLGESVVMGALVVHLGETVLFGQAVLVAGA